MQNQEYDYVGREPPLRVKVPVVTFGRMFHGVARRKIEAGSRRRRSAHERIWEKNSEHAVRVDVLQL
jgi:hypothetical protein